MNRKIEDTRKNIEDVLMKDNNNSMQTYMKALIKANVNLYMHGVANFNVFLLIIFTTVKVTSLTNSLTVPLLTCGLFSGTLSI